MKLTAIQILQQAITAHKEERFEEAEKFYYSALEAQPTNLDAHNNLGVLLTTLGKFDEAIARYKKAIELKPDYTEAHFNLGIALNEHGKLDEAEICFKKVIELKPNYVDAYNNLGHTLQKIGKFDEAEAIYKKVIKLNPNSVQAYIFLGAILSRLGRLSESKEYYEKVLDINPKSFEDYNNLGVALSQLDRFEEAEKNYRKAIEINSNFAQAKNNLKTTVKINKLLKLKQVKKFNEVNIKNSVSKSHIELLDPNPFITNRAVEEELLKYLYKVNSIELYELKNFVFGKKAARFGNGRCSLGFHLFEEGSPIIKTLEKDLIKIMSDAVKSDIFISDSFFNILGKGGGSTPHTHIDSFDEIRGLDKQKFSLVYYLTIGDQKCSEPGILKIYDPDQEILPSKGSIIIIPANRFHSAVYGGKKDRVLIGVNFYGLL